MTKRLFTRRAALKTLGAGAGAVTLLPWLSDEAVAAFAEIQRANVRPAPLVLSEPQYATLEKIVEAIIPSDERSPGAREARVADYIDLLLSEADDELRRQWLGGLVALDAEATTRFGGPFLGLDAQQADTLLGDLSRNERPAPGAEQTPLEKFFVQTKHATVHGYYTSEIGIHKELRYKGNQLLAEFVGCQTEDGKDCPHCGQKAEA